MKQKLLCFFVLGFLLISSAYAQDRRITGRVTSSEQPPTALVGVTVSVPGTSIATQTDNNGQYSINVPASAQTLEFRFLGFSRQVLPIVGTTLNVTLESDATDLDEVVVTGYGTTSRLDMTGSVATVKATQIESRPLTSIDKALQGQVAGLQSVAASGQPGASQSIRIRGVSSINASNQPLWVIDGVPVNSGDASRLQTTANLLSTLNPNDIESITVLKDAASQSIYGSRAANGVIIVTTKAGRAGKTNIRFDTEFGASDIAYENAKYRPLNAEDFFTITREGLINAGATEAQVTNNLNALGYGNGVDQDWLDATTRNGSQQLYNLSLDGGNEKTTFYLSSGFFSQEGTTINSRMDRISGSVRLGHKVSDKLNLNFNLNGGNVSQRAPLSGGAFGNPVLSSFFMLPSRPIKNDDGSWNFTNLGGLHNTVALTEIDKRFMREASLRGSISGEYEIIQNLRFKSTFGADYNAIEEDQYNNPFHGDGAASGGRAYSYYTRYFNWIWTNTLDYGFHLLDQDLKVDLQAGYEAQTSLAYFSSLQNQDFPLTTELTYPAVGARPTTASATISNYAFLSQFSSATLNYKQRYVLSGSFRRDGSSRFGENNRYGNFWSVGGSWNIDQEEFMADVNSIDQLKLRSSYGVNGNAGIGNYDWWPLYGFGFNYNQQPGSAPSNIGDRNLTWELNKPFNVGVDVSMFNNRLGFTVEYYNRKSENLLMSVPLSRTSGFSSATRNIGALQNSGLEVTINGDVIRKDDFTWNVDFNYASNQNEITSLPNGEEIISGAFIIREGESLNSFFIRSYAGVDPANGDPLWYENGRDGATTNVYANAERDVYGTALPKHFGALTNTFNFKGFVLDAQLYYNFGNYVQDAWGGYYTGAGFGQSYGKVNRIMDRWQNPGDVTDMPKYVWGGNKSFNSLSSFYLAKGDFIRLRNVQLGYQLPQSILNSIKLNRVFVYARGTNLFTWVSDKNLAFDPEQGTSSQTNLDVFIPKTVTFGINVTL